MGLFGKTVPKTVGMTLCWIKLEKVVHSIFLFVLYFILHIFLSINLFFFDLQKILEHYAQVN